MRGRTLFFKYSLHRVNHDNRINYLHHARSTGPGSPDFGTTVRTRGVLGRFAAGITGLTGGKAHSYVVELDKARNEAIENMVEQAKERGADAVIGVALDISEVLEGYIMVTATGTAVKLK